MRTLPRYLVPLLGALLLLPARAAAQELRVIGEVDDSAAVRLREIVARGQYRIVARDTVLPASAAVAGDLIVVSARVRVEGRVGGSVAVLPGGEFYLRPGGVVAGSAIVLGGGLYLSANATVGERLELPAYVGTRLVREGPLYTLHLAPPAPLPLLEPAGGVYGVGIPTYDRVNGATLRAGALLRLRADTTAPVVRASALYHSGRQAFGGEVDLTSRLGARHYARLEVARRAETRDAWIRGDLANTLAALLFRSDVRDYHEADRVVLEVGRRAVATLDPGEAFVAPRVRLAASRARSLPALDTWSLFGGDDWRANPAIDDGTIVSAAPGALFGWRGVTSRIAGEAELEWAPGAGGDFSFALLTADATWSMLALWRHTIDVRARVAHPLGSDGAPRQRWSILGGPGTLPTFATGEMRGDRLAYVESAYTIPVPRIVLPVVGAPSLVIRHAVGNAWSGGAGEGMPPLEQNLGAAIAFRLGRVALDVDPRDPGRRELSVAASLPF